MEGKIHHWKHGWIPLDDYARSIQKSKGQKKERVVQGQVILPKADDNSLYEAIEEHGGFTYDPAKGGLLEVGKASGFSIAVPGTEQIVGEEKVGESLSREDFAAGVAKILRDPKNAELFKKGAVLGGWYSPERNQYMVEISQIFPPHDREGAIRAGRERNQEGIFDLSTGETILTGGSGDSPLRMTTSNPLNDFTAAVTPEEVAAAKYYSGPGYKPLNNALRAGRAPHPHAAAYMRQLDTLLSSSRTNKDVTTYRGVQSGSWLPAYLAPGTMWTEDGYVSSAVADSPPDKYTGDTTMVIRVPAGTHALDMNAFGFSHHPDETELLMPHGQQLRVVSDASVSGRRTIEFEVVR